MTLTRPYGIGAAFPNADDVRKHLSAVYPREGVLPDPITTAAAGIAYAGTGWGVNARAFVAVLKRGGNAFTQAYGSALISNDGVVTGAWTITAAPASGSRIDLLCIRGRDASQGDSTAGTPNDGPSGANRSGIPEFLVVTGTAGTSPVAPALPAGYEEIARVQTPSGAASIAGSTITNTYGFAQVLGGPIYVRTASALPSAASEFPYEEAIALDTGIHYKVIGGAWVRYLSPAIAFTPTWQNVTVGNGTTGGTYEFIGPGLYRFSAWVIFGSTSAMVGSARLVLPFTAVVETGAIPWDSNNLVAGVNRGGSFFAPLAAVMNEAAGANVEILAIGANGTYAGYSAMSSSVPGPWGSGAIMSVSGIIRTAS